MHRCNSSGLFSQTNFAKLKIQRVTLLELAVLPQESGRSWGDVSSWVTSLCPYYPAGSACHLIQSTVNEVEKQADDSFV